MCVRGGGVEGRGPGTARSNLVHQLLEGDAHALAGLGARLDEEHGVAAGRRRAPPGGRAGRPCWQKYD